MSKKYDNYNAGFISCDKREAIKKNLEVIKKMMRPGNTNKDAMSTGNKQHDCPNNQITPIEECHICKEEMDMPPRVWIDKNGLENAKKRLDLGEAIPVELLLYPHKDTVQHLIHFISLAEHEAAMADNESENSSAITMLHAIYQDRLDAAEALLGEAEKALELAATCLSLQADEVRMAKKIISDDPFENSEEGCESLEAIAGRLKMASRNIKAQETKLRERKR